MFPIAAQLSSLKYIPLLHIGILPHNYKRSAPRRDMFLESFPQAPDSVVSNYDILSQGWPGL